MTPKTLPLRGATVGELLRHATRAFGERTAVVSSDTGERLSFHDLDARADEIARACVAAGLMSGDRAVVWATNRPAWIELQYGLARAGVVLVTANTAFKQSEIEYLIRQCEAKALFFGPPLTDGVDYPQIVREIEDRLPALELRVGIDGAASTRSLDLDAFKRLGEGVTAAQYEARLASLDRNDVINMQYTSGTTGFPKGVMLSHANIVENGAAVAEGIGFSPDDRLCLSVPLFHCFGCVIGTLAAHSCGVSIYLHDAFKADAILDTIEQEGCTALYGVPTMFTAELEKLRHHPRALPSLRVGIMAGALAPPALVREVIEEFPLPGLVIAYGLTEASPGITLSRPTDPIDERKETVGRELPGVEVRIVDPSGKSDDDLGTGREGELWSRGANTMVGYFGDPDATRAAITPEGWLRTGDLAIRDERGAYRIVGRIKDLIIRGGENISPTQIEMALRDHPAILDAAAFAIHSDFFGEDVAAAVRLVAGERVDEATLQEFVRSRLSDHKVPAQILFVDGFPLTGSGKVKRFELRRRFEEGTL